MAEKTVTQVLAAGSNPNELRLDPSSLLFQLAAIANDLSALAAELRTDHATFKSAADTAKRALVNLPLSDGGVALATTKSKVKTAANVTYLINGEFKVKNATDNLWTLTGDAVAAAMFQKWLLCLDTDGAASVVIGTAGATAAEVVLPAWPANKSVVGVLTVQNGSAADFTPGTTLLDAADITATYYDGFPAALLGDAPATIAAGAADTITFSNGITP
jgi:hypothetical protein